MNNLVVTTNTSASRTSPTTPRPRSSRAATTCGSARGLEPPGLAKNIETDPLLANPENSDFHLRAGSPAIGAGIMTAATLDFDGNPRRTSFDLGAYEHAQ